MKTKQIESIIEPPRIRYVGDGFRVHNFIPYVPQLSMERMNPFILLDYNANFYFDATDTPRGVGVHPHRGFETVTIAYKGRIQHHDSSGGGGIIGEGEVQWMTAAGGVLHKEYHEVEWSKKGGNFHMVQLWVNLPAKDKTLPAKYQAITKDMIAKYNLENDGGEIEIIAGEYKGVHGPASTFSPMHVMNAHLKTGGEANFSFPADYNTAILVIEGSIIVNGEDEVPTDYFVLFENKGEDFNIMASEDAIVLILSGQPLHEPISAYGPFVMNTKEEIKQAYDDFNQGKFGYLED